ncbi:MAG: efflux RND transporter periplasmic adaptor subunit [Brevundimonas sp.]|nr:MAG: efflux RND transporter periplasmic adaptor subunit [Brevundimonas sp.]
MRTSPMTPASLNRLLTSKTALVAAALFAATSLSACGGGHDKDASTSAAKADTPARAVRVALVQQRPIEGGLSAPGVLISREEAAVSAEVTGFRVARVLADLGDQVKAGQPLVQLDDTLLRSQIDQAQALSAQAEVQARQAAAQASRVDGLDRTGALAQEQIEQRRFGAETARAQAAAQAASLKDLQTRAGKMVVRSPVSGVVLERTVRPGDLSGTGAQPMFRIVRDNQVELEAQVGENDLPAIKTGSNVTVTLPDTSRFTGQVRLVAPSVDENTKLGRVRVRLPVSPALRPGGFGRAEFSGSGVPVLAVPETAVRQDADGVSVMVVDQTNHVRQVKVKTGRRGNGFVELLNGPPAGSRVLLGSSSFVLEGDLVKPVN